MVHVPTRFRDLVISHLAHCYMAAPGTGHGQILAILGAPGCGKTFQLNAVCADQGIKIYNFGAEDVESPSANEPVRFLRNQLEAVRSGTLAGEPGVLVVDDADLLLGRVTLTQYTHNLQRVVATLMESATSVSVRHQNSVPAPVIMLANQASIMHGPLLRPGRARVYEWNPTNDEVRNVLRSMFSQLSDDDIDVVTTRFSNASIATFGTIRDALSDDRVNRLIEQVGVPRILRYCLRNASKLTNEFTYSLEDVLRAGESVLNEVQVLKGGPLE